MRRIRSTLWPENGPKYIAVANAIKSEPPSSVSAFDKIEDSALNNVKLMDPSELPSEAPRKPKPKGGSRSRALALVLLVGAGIAAVAYFWDGGGKTLPPAGAAKAAQRDAYGAKIAEYEDKLKDPSLTDAEKSALRRRLSTLQHAKEVDLKSGDKELTPPK